MSTYPQSPRTDFLFWCQAHASVFSSHAADLGLTSAQTAAFSAGVAQATLRLTNQQAARQAAQAATEAVNDAFVSLRRQAGEIVRTVRAFAETQEDPNAVYQLAEIPAPAAPTPVPPPAQPSDLRVQLDAATGALTLRWKAQNPKGASGTSYIVRRRLAGESAFTFLGATGKKVFVDSTLVAGPDSVQYTVQGQRADLAGPISPIFTVTFGKAPGGQTVVGRVSSETTPAPVRMAA